MFLLQSMNQQALHILLPLLLLVQVDRLQALDQKVLLLLLQVDRL